MYTVHVHVRMCVEAVHTCTYMYNSLHSELSHAIFSTMHAMLFSTVPFSSSLFEVRKNVLYMRKGLGIFLENCEKLAGTRD